MNNQKKMSNTNNVKKTTNKPTIKSLKTDLSNANRALSSSQKEVKNLKETNEFLVTNLKNIDFFLADLVNQVDENGRSTERWFGVSFFPRKWDAVSERLSVLAAMAKAQKELREKSENTES